jgi:phosphomannomutase
MPDLLLFDIDGTLTKPRQPLSASIRSELSKLSERVPLAVVGGSDLAKQDAQLGPARHLFKHRFAENGLVQVEEDGSVSVRQTLADHLGEAELARLADWIRAYLSKLPFLPNRSSIECRVGMLNVAFPGHAASAEERRAFAILDESAKIREAFAAQLCENFPRLRCAIGGEISVDVFAAGWDKTYCLSFLQSLYKDIHFFGDKTLPGGNDFELFEDPRVTGHRVSSPQDTLRQVALCFPQNLSKKSKMVVTSGYFNPLHVGHLELLQLSKAYAEQQGARLLVIVNNDRQVYVKKRCPPAMCEAERLSLVKAIRYADEVFLSVDTSPSICESLRACHELYHLVAFTKGGDRFSAEVPESAVCRDLGIRLLDGFGEKIQSSTALTEAALTGTMAPAAPGFDAAQL